MHTRRYQSFAVPATSGQYAPEVIYLRQQQDGGTFDAIERLSAYVDALPSGATVEVDLLKANSANRATPASTDWLGPAATVTATGLADLITLAGWYGGRIRVKSGGTAGTATLHATWTDEA